MLADQRCGVVVWRGPGRGLLGCWPGRQAAVLVCLALPVEQAGQFGSVPGIGSPVILGSRGAGQDAGGDVLTDTAVQLSYPILPGNGVGVGVGSAGRRDETGYRAFPQEGRTESVESG